MRIHHRVPHPYCAAHANHPAQPQPCHGLVFSRTTATMPWPCALPPTKPSAVGASLGHCRRGMRLHCHSIVCHVCLHAAVLCNACTRTRYAMCVATSWNGPHSAANNHWCNFKCNAASRVAKTGEDGVLVRKGAGNLCASPHPPPSPAPAPTPASLCPPSIPPDWRAPCERGDLFFEDPNGYANAAMCMCVCVFICAPAICAGLVSSTCQSAGRRVQGDWTRSPSPLYSPLRCTPISPCSPCQM